MIITPYPQETTIKLYRGLGWDRSYKDIRWFDSYASRDAYLASRVAQTWYECSVVNKNEIKLEGQQMDFIDCDYMTFLNPSGTGKQKMVCCWVTSVDYVNINTFRVTYEIDFIATWMADIRFEPCLVLQEHVNDDTPGIWPSEDGMDIGDPQVMGVLKTYYSPVVMIGFLTEDQLSTVDFDHNLMSAMDYQCYEMTAANKIFIKQILDTRKEKPELVPFISMAVKPFLSGGGSQGKAEEFEQEYSITAATLEFYNESKTYTAKNNKLKCFPYKFMTVDNYNGQVEQYKYEDFEFLHPRFKVVGVPYPTPILSMFPIDYKNYDIGNYTQQSVVYDNFPRVGWLTSAFALESWRYISQPLITMGSSLAVAAGTGNVISGVMGAVSGATSLISSYQNYKYDEKTLHSRQFKASGSSGSINFAMGDIGFRITAYQIKPDIAERIDNYFTRYGYPNLNVYKVPNITGRKSVNFVKTANARVGGIAPLETREKMEQILNAGVSFWHVDEQSGDLDNPIVG